MECELADELGYEKSERTSNDECGKKSKNYRNGYSKKTVKTQMGELEIKVPRDRNGEYEPKIISKYNRNVDGMEEKILSLYACGMSQRDIAEQIKNLYDVEISPELVSKISEKIMPDVTAWQNRPLESVYPFVFMDAIHYKVKENHQYITKAAYVVLGINLDGQKDILGIWIGENASANQSQAELAINMPKTLPGENILDDTLLNVKSSELPPAYMSLSTQENSNLGECPYSHKKGNVSGCPFMNSRNHEPKDKKFDYHYEVPMMETARDFYFNTINYTKDKLKESTWVRSMPKYLRNTLFIKNKKIEEIRNKNLLLFPS